MIRRTHSRLSLLDALLGLTLEPTATIGELLGERTPRHVFKLTALLLLTIFAPIIWYSEKLGILSTFHAEQAIIAILLLICISLIFFTVVESWFFLLLAIDCSPLTVYACLAYGFVPASCVIGALYFLDWHTNRSFALVDILLLGGISSPPPFLHLMPWIVAGTGLWVANLFFLAVAHVGRTSSLTALGITFISAVVFAVSFAVGLFVAELLYPGIMNSVVLLLTSPESLTNGPSSNLRALMP
jgi:hypothetical protein